MVPKRTPKNAPKKAKKSAEIIEISSDSEPEAPQPQPQQQRPVRDEAPSPATQERVFTEEDYARQPLLRVPGIKYHTPKTQAKEPVKPKDDEPTEAQKSSPGSAKLPVRVKDTGSARHRHVSIEIPLPTSSMLSKGKGDRQEIPDSDGEHNEDVFKTPMERRHITFNDSDNEEFVTPMEAPSRNPLEASLALSSSAPKEQEQEGEEEEDSDDEAPEAVSSHAAGAQLAKAAQAVAKAAEQQAAEKKRKRQELDALLKQQAEERKAAQKAALPQGASDDEAPAKAKGPAPLFPEKRKREIPKRLPLELLESDDEDDADLDESPKRQKVNLNGQKWITGPKPPKDKKEGSTVFRVVENHGDNKLAPKMNKNSKNLREQLLKRNRVAQVKRGSLLKSR